MASLKTSRFILGALLWVMLPVYAEARVVWVDEGKGNGFLFHHRGNCFMFLPTHVYGRRPVGRPIDLSARDPAGIGVARVLHKSKGADLSLAVVSGNLTNNCGPDWADLPKQLDLRAGMDVTVVRYQMGSIETIRAEVTTTTFTHIELTPRVGENRDFFAKTSGATVFRGDTPVGMVIEADTRDKARALRMDEIRARLNRYIGDRYDQSGGATTIPSPKGLSDFRLTSWSTQTSETGVPPEDMLAGLGPYIAAIGPKTPITLTFEADEIKEVSRVVLKSNADGAETFTPKRVTVRVDTSSSGINIWRNFVSPRDMVPGQPLDLKSGKTFARRIEIRIQSSWGGNPVRLDSVAIE